MTRHCRCTYLAADCAQFGICRFRGAPVHCVDCGREIDADEEIYGEGEALCGGCVAGEAEANEEAA